MRAHKITRVAQLLLLLLALVAFAERARAQDVWPAESWPRAEPDEVGLDEAQLEKARDYALSGGGSGMIIRHGKLVMQWGDQQQRYDLKSTTKSIGVTALGLAIQDGKMQLDDKALKHHSDFGVPPKTNRDTGWLNKITLWHLAAQTAGFEKPGGYTPLIFEPGTRWAYSDGGPNWLAECVTLAYGRDLRDLMFERIFKPLGISDKDLTWRRNAYRDAKIAGVMRREFGSGISANVDAMARIGYLYLREGRWRDKPLLPAEFVRQAAGPQKRLIGIPEVDPDQYGNASDHYGLLWWNNADGTLDEVPHDAYWSWGLYDSLIVVIPSLDIVAARAGRSWNRPSQEHYAVLQPFLHAVAAAAGDKHRSRSRKTDDSSGAAPYPASALVRVEWDDAETIIRQAAGSDNWPLTWGDDGRMYTAYGDGWGFKPRVPRKLSLGLATVTGGPGDFQGHNLRASTAEQLGDGPRGKKASGMLMVEGVLYMFVRNADNSQLAWSEDRGQSWQWCDWRMTTSFGCPTFLNFGRNYAGARDDYVYVYSHDSDSAYDAADQLVLARVRRDELRERDAYEFFTDAMPDGSPQWSKDVEQRSSVFRFPGQCYRTTASYHAGLQRYLLCQTLPGSDARFEGGFGIYEAPEPWGPWSTVYFTRRWDVGPGETASLPTKWLSDDGSRFHLVFSGNDAFSVRGGRFLPAAQ